MLHQLKEQKLRRGNVALGPAVLRAARAADKKLMFVPMLFILCRIWGTIRFLIFWAGALSADNSRLIHKILLSLQAVGDSSQGFVNCILFCFLTPKVCNHLTEAFWQICGCCLGHQNSKYKAIKAIDSSSGLKNSSTTCMGEKSSLFHSSIGSVSTYGIYPTLN